MLTFTDTQVRGAALAYRAADRATRAAVNDAVRQLQPVWAQQVARHVSTEQDRLIGRPSVQGGNPPAVTGYTGGARNRLSGGLSTAQWWAVEFGSAGGHGRRGQLPRRRRSGRIMYAALPGFLPRVVSAWVGGIYAAYGRAVDEG